MSSKFYGIKKKNLALALNFMGFKFIENINDDGTIIYTFRRTTEFEVALNGLLELRKQIQSKYD